MATKEELKKLRKIYEEESAKIILYHDVVFDLLGFDSEVEIVFLREDEDSPEELTFEMVADFEKRIRDEINTRWYVGIFFTDSAAADAAQMEEHEYQT